jgi:hypothetical protein
MFSHKILNNFPLFTSQHTMTKSCSQFVQTISTFVPSTAQRYRQATQCSYVETCARKWLHITTVLPSISIHALQTMNAMEHTNYRFWTRMGFNGMHCDCNCFTSVSIIWTIVCKIYIHFVFTSIWYVHIGCVLHSHYRPNCLALHFFHYPCQTPSSALSFSAALWCSDYNFPTAAGNHSFFICFIWANNPNMFLHSFVINYPLL